MSHADIDNDWTENVMLPEGPEGGGRAEEPALRSGVGTRWTSATARCGDPRSRETGSRADSGSDSPTCACAPSRGREGMRMRGPGSGPGPTHAQRIPSIRRPAGEQRRLHSTDPSPRYDYNEMQGLQTEPRSPALLPPRRENPPPSRPDRARVATLPHRCSKASLADSNSTTRQDENQSTTTYGPR